MIAMHKLNYQDDRQDSQQVGFIANVFDKHGSFMYRGDFCKRLMEDECQWIFDDHLIRERLRKFYEEEKELNREN